MATFIVFKKIYSVFVLQLEGAAPPNYKRYLIVVLGYPYTFLSGSQKRLTDNSKRMCYHVIVMLSGSAEDGGTTSRRVVTSPTTFVILNLEGYKVSEKLYVGSKQAS